MTNFKTEYIDTPMDPHDDPYLALANLFLRWLVCDDKQKSYDLLVKFRVAMEQMEKAVPSMRKDLRVLESHMFLESRDQAKTLWPEIEFELLERWQPSDRKSTVAEKTYGDFAIATWFGFIGKDRKRNITRWRKERGFPGVNPTFKEVEVWASTNPWALKNNRRIVNPPPEAKAEDKPRTIEDT